MRSARVLRCASGVERVVITPHQSQQVAAVIAIVGMVGLAGLFEVTLDARPEELPENLIERVMAQTTRSGVRLRATRELRAGTRSGKHQGWMNIETAISPSGAFTWTVLEEGGSERTRNKVFREVLQAEAEAWRTGAHDAAALTLANYEFLPMAPAHSGLVQIRLKPRRADVTLVDGTLTVSADGYPVVLEGTLAKSPSFWVKSVTIVKRFGRFAGIALPTTIESIADVKLFGPSTFAMRYRYSEVNGRSVELSN